MRKRSQCYKIGNCQIIPNYYLYINENSDKNTIKNCVERYKWGHFLLPQIRFGDIFCLFATLPVHKLLILPVIIAKYLLINIVDIYKTNIHKHFVHARAI